MKQIKETICSENGMRIVNGLFFLSLVIRNSGFIICAHGLWLLFLIYCIRSTPSKAAKIVYLILAVYAAVMVAVNLYLFFVH